MRALLMASALTLGTSCGGTSTPPARPHEPIATPTVTESDPPVVAGAVSRKPIEIQVVAKKSGPTVMLEITGIARGHLAGKAFEDATRWTVGARAGGAPLRRVLNGPVKLERIPVGRASGDQWDVYVRFSVAFAIDDSATAVEVSIQPPEAALFEKSYPL